MQPTCLEEGFLKKQTIWDIFSYKCDLVKCSCPVSGRAKKRIFANSNADILQFTQ